MIYTVIISHHQSEWICRFPFHGSTVVVLDDPTDADFESCDKAGYDSICMYVQGNRGKNRNAGIDYILETYRPSSTDVIQCFDGDRIPIKYNEQYIMNAMSAHSIGILLFTCEHDQRLKKINLAVDSTAIIDTGVICNPFYSCGFAATVDSIKRIKACNCDSLFNPRFKEWGCEDQFTGLLCYQCGIRVGLTNKIQLRGSVGGDENTHECYRDSLQEYIDAIREFNIPIRTVADPMVVCQNGVI